MSLDYYPTPAWATEAILDALPPIATWRVLDPFAGDGAILRVVAARGATPIGLELDGVLAREAGAQCRDSLSDTLWPEADIVITNPPYATAQRCIERCLAESDRVVALLRLGFLASRRRADLHRRHPSDVYVLSRRPSFVGGRTDASDYAWFAWPGRNRWKILP